MIISVTKTHIKEGIRNTADRCPIALALLEAFPRFRWSVTNIRIETKYDSYHCPRSVSRFVSKFDKTGKATPFKFILRKKP